MNQRRIKKILVVALDNLGDVVMGTSIFRHLKQVYPEAKIGYWVKNYAAGLFEDHSLVDQVHASDPFWDDAPGHPKGRFLDFRSTMKAIQRERYDATLILNTEWRRSLACAWMRIPIRFGYHQRQSSFFLTGSIPIEVGLHVVEENTKLVEAWTKTKFHPALALPRLEVSEPEKNWVVGWLRKHDWVNHPIVMCHPFAGRDIRCWPLVSWFDLIRDLIAIHPQIRFVLVCDQSEATRLKDALPHLPHGSVLELAGVPLAQVKAVMSMSHVFIGGDSGPGHMAAALGRPVVSLFGPSNPQRSAPRGHGPIKVLQRAPIQELSVSEVKSAVLELLGALS